MTNHTPPRPWLDTETAPHLTTADLAKLDADYVRWTTDDSGMWKSTHELVDYLRDCARDQARIRRIMGPSEAPLPEFVTDSKHSPWELTDDGTDCVRYLEADSADHRAMTAWLEVDQYAVSTRLDMRVHIDEGGTCDPAELIDWALDLLALADRWKQIRATEGR